MNGPEDIARRLIGTPYMHQGRMPFVGLDCIGLVVMIAKELGIPYEDRSDYAMTPYGKTLKDALDKYLDTRQGPHQPGDVLLFAFGVLSDPQHVAILTSKNTIIHSYSEVGKVVEHNFSPVWRMRVISSYSWPGAK